MLIRKRYTFVIKMRLWYLTLLPINASMTVLEDVLILERHISGHFDCEDRCVTKSYCVLLNLALRCLTLLP